MLQPSTADSSNKNVQAVKNFTDKLMWLYEPEYGDFKRKVGLYLLRLEQELGGEAQKPEVRRAFSSLRDKVVYQPSGQVEPTRELVLNWALDLQSKISQ